MWRRRQAGRTAPAATAHWAAAQSVRPTARPACAAGVLAAVVDGQAGRAGCTVRPAGAGAAFVRKSAPLQLRLAAVRTFAYLTAA